MKLHVEIANVNKRPTQTKVNIQFSLMTHKTFVTKAKIYNMSFILFTFCLVLVRDGQYEHIPINVLQFFSNNIKLLEIICIDMNTFFQSKS